MSAAAESNFWQDLRLWCRYLRCCPNAGGKRLTGVTLERDKDEYSECEEMSESEYTQAFTFLTTQEKSSRILSLWLRAYTKSKAAATLLAKFRDVKRKIDLSG